MEHSSLPPTRQSRSPLLIAVACVLVCGCAPSVAYSHHPKVVSQESSGAARAEVFGTVEVATEVLSLALSNATTWCEILILPSTNDACVPAPGKANTQLDLDVRSHSGAEPAQMRFELIADGKVGGSFKAGLRALKGPYGTSDYEIAVQLHPSATGTRVHLSLSLRTGIAARLVMQAYFSMAGRGKIGFTSEVDTAGELRFSTGTRAMLERSAMRHYLALMSWAGSARLPQGERARGRAMLWIEAAQQYPRQLQEPSRDAYLASMSRKAKLPVPNR